LTYQKLLIDVEFALLERTEEYNGITQLEKIKLGVTASVIHEEDGLNITAQMVSYKYDPLLKAYISVALGSSRYYQPMESSKTNIRKFTETKSSIQKWILNRGYIQGSQFKISFVSTMWNVCSQFYSKSQNTCNKKRSGQSFGILSKIIVKSIQK